MSIRKRGSGGSRGYTLIEVLLAASIFSLLAGAAVAFLHATRNLDQRIHRQGRARQIARAVLRILERDIRSAFASGGPFGTGIVGTDGSGEWDADEIELVTTAHRPTRAREGTAAKETDLARVIYKIDPELGLVRLNMPRLTSNDRVIREEEIREPVSSHVVGMNLRYHDGQGWTDAWDSTSTGTMPRAVEIVLTVEVEGYEETVRSAFWLPVGATYEPPAEE